MSHENYPKCAAGRARRCRRISGPQEALSPAPHPVPPLPCPALLLVTQVAPAAPAPTPPSGAAPRHRRYIFVDEEWPKEHQRWEQMDFMELTAQEFQKYIKKVRAPDAGRVTAGVRGGGGRPCGEHVVQLGVFFAKGQNIAVSCTSTERPATAVMSQLTEVAVTRWRGRAD